jgi:hypothetical protein
MGIRASLLIALWSFFLLDFWVMTKTSKSQPGRPQM